LTSEDVVRHNLVGRIVDAYTRYDAERQAARFDILNSREATQKPDNRGRP